MKKTIILFLALFVALGAIGASAAAQPNEDQGQGTPNGGEGQGFGQGNDHDGDQGNNNGNGNGNDQCDDDEDDDDDQCDDDEEDHDECGTAAIGDRVWNDTNANGIQDVGEQGIANVTVNLWNGNETNPIKQIATTKTDENGNYYFKNLIKGIYWLEFIAPTATDGTWIFSPQDQGTDNWIDSDSNASGIAGPINVNENKYCPTWDAGLYQYATLGDLVWTDTNKNGIQDPGELGVAGVIVNLWSNVNNAPGSIVKTTTTNASGYYLFTDIVPGTYWLQFVLPNEISSWVFTLQNQGTNDTLDSDANATGFAGPIELISGEVDLTWDAGLDPGSAAGGDEEEPTDEAAGGEEVIEIIEEVAAASEEIPLQETGVPILPGVLAALMIGGGLLGRRLRK